MSASEDMTNDIGKRAREEAHDSAIKDARIAALEAELADARRKGGEVRRTLLRRVRLLVAHEGEKIRGSMKDGPRLDAALAAHEQVAQMLNALGETDEE